MIPILQCCYLFLTEYWSRIQHSTTTRKEDDNSEFTSNKCPTFDIGTYSNHRDFCNSAATADGAGLVVLLVHGEKPRQRAVGARQRHGHGLAMVHGRRTTVAADAPAPASRACLP
ncbi:hypothetical protein D1007_24044 [Hordeum vulgare]|nr:hypothetical protein D1007_24044 [Hordeum vulgare]